MLYYWYFIRGKLSDTYISCPDYFGKLLKKKLAATGKPAAFDGLLDKRSQAKLRKLIDRETDYVLEEERLAAILKVLKIPAEPAVAALPEVVARNQPALKMYRNPSPTIVKSGGIIFTLGAYTSVPEKIGMPATVRKKGGKRR